MIIGRAINKINPKAKYQYTDINNITWLEGTIPISKSEIEAKIIELQAEYNSNQYQRDRAKEYPDFRDYLDGIVKGDQAQINKYIADCLAIKAKYPKE